MQQRCGHFDILVEIKPNPYLTHKINLKFLNTLEYLTHVRGIGLIEKSKSWY